MTNLIGDGAAAHAQGELHSMLEAKLAELDDDFLERARAYN